MGKIVYNNCYGGFSLSDAATKRYAESKFGDPEHKVWDWEIERDDPILVEIVESMGSEANGMCANLQIEEIPAGTLWHIDEYDGSESVATQDSYEWKVAK